MLGLPKTRYYQDGGTKIYTSFFYQEVHFNTLDWCTASASWYGIHLEWNYEYYFNKFCKKPNQKVVPESQDEEHDTSKLNSKLNSKTNTEIPQNSQIQRNETSAKQATGFIYHKEYDAGEYSENYQDKFDTRYKIWEEAEKNDFRAEWKHFKELYLSNYKKNEEYTISFNNDKYFLQLKEGIGENESHISYIVSKNKKQIFEWKTQFLFNEPLRNFIVNADWWWLSYERVKSYMKNGKPGADMGKNILVHNGEKLPYYDVIWLQDFNWKTFYFFKKDKTSKIQYYLDGKIFDTDFDEIIHNKCCSYGHLDESISQDGRITFWGIKNNNISYNQIILPWFDETLKNLPKLQAIAHQKRLQEEKEEARKPCKTLLTKIVYESSQQKIKEYIDKVDKTKTSGGFFEIPAEKIGLKKEEDMLYLGIVVYDSELQQEFIPQKYQINTKNLDIHEIISNPDTQEITYKKIPQSTSERSKTAIEEYHAQCK